ncbi:MAG TPA: hypothetical protein VMU54_25835 [Planctomycetota bacterium]|nr:hypothetical protein [Planctomycetota bacterium]
MTVLTLIVLMSCVGAPADESQAKPASPVAPAQDSERPAIPAAELKALRENNIFAPRSAKFRPPKAPGGSSRATPAAPIKPRAPVVTGVFFDEKLQCQRVIVEDKNDAAHKFFKEPMFMKVGDEWGGFKVEAVTQEKATFSKGGVSKEVGIGESFPEVDRGSLDDESGVDDGAPIPQEPSASPSSTKKSSSGNRSESRGDGKSEAPENQSQTLENMKRRLKKNRSSDPEE